MTTDNLLAQLDRQTSNADEWRKEAARALSLLDDANKQIAVLRSPARRGSDDVDDEAERLFWCFAAMLDCEPRQVRERFALRPDFPRSVRPGGTGHPRWNAAEVDAWMRRQRETA